MKLIVAGSRYLEDYFFVKSKLDALLGLCSETEEITIISGRCDTGIVTFITDEGIKVYGADGLGERYAKENGYKVDAFPADWNKYGLAAGPIRNEQMASHGTHCVVFWDGKSKGSKNMVKCAKKAGLPTIEVMIKK